MSSKGYGIEVFVCACAVVVGLCIAGPRLMGADTDTGGGIHFSPTILEAGDVFYNQDTKAIEFQGPGFLDVKMLSAADSVYRKGNRLMLSLKPGESATFTPEKGEK